MNLLLGIIQEAIGIVSRKDASNRKSVIINHYKLEMNVTNPSYPEQPNS